MCVCGGGGGGGGLKAFYWQKNRPRLFCSKSSHEDFLTCAMHHPRGGLTYYDELNKRSSESVKETLKLSRGGPSATITDKRHCSRMET